MKMSMYNGVNELAVRPELVSFLYGALLKCLELLQ